MTDYQTDNQPTDLSAHELRYSSDDVKAAAEINEGTLQNWLARGELELTQQNPGRGKARLYSKYDVARIRFVKRLIDLGLSLSLAAKIAALFYRTWQLAPGFLGAANDEPGFVDWVLITPAIGGSAGKLFGLDLQHSHLHVDGFSVIWAKEVLSSKKRLGDALHFFGESPLIVLNMSALLRETDSALKARLPQPV